MSDPAAHPALKLVGLGASSAAADPVDAAREHDAVLADAEIRSWSRDRKDDIGS